MRVYVTVQSFGMYLMASRFMKNNVLVPSMWRLYPLDSLPNSLHMPRLQQGQVSLFLLAVDHLISFRCLYPLHCTCNVAVGLKMIVESTIWV